MKAGVLKYFACGGLLSRLDRLKKFKWMWIELIL